MMQPQQKPQTIPFDVLLDNFLASQQSQLNVVRMLIKNLREKNIEVMNLKGETIGDAPREYLKETENEPTDPTEDETDD